MHDPRPEWLPAGRVGERIRRETNTHTDRLSHTPPRKEDRSRDVRGEKSTCTCTRTGKQLDPRGPGCTHSPDLDPWTLGPLFRPACAPSPTVTRHPSTPLSALRRPLTWEGKRDDAAAGVAPLGMDQEARARALSVPGTVDSSGVEAVVVVPHSPFPSVGRRKGKALAMARQHSSNRMLCRHREAVRPLPSPPTTSTPPFTTLLHRGRTCPDSRQPIIHPIGRQVKGERSIQTTRSPPATQRCQILLPCAQSTCC